ncbi:MAG: MCP four helix bundle domain-containing protein [Magnetococcales bacterium]|nr:MCP four helix bundle domain-containing protein [Magnetococcales bacterium]
MIFRRWNMGKMGVRTKVSLWSGIAMIWVMVLGGVGLFFIDRVAHVSLALVDTNAVPMIAVGQIKESVWEIYLRAILHAGLNKPEEMDKLTKEVEQLSTQLAQQLEQYGQRKENDQRWQGAFKAAWHHFQQITKQAHELSRSFAKEEAMRLLFVEGNQAFGQVVHILKELEAAHGQQMALLRQQAERVQDRAISWVTAITLLFGLMVLAGWWYARIVSRSLGKVANDLASSTAQMRETIRIQEGAMAQQAAAVRETNTTLEELGSSARQSAEQAEVAGGGAQAAMDFAAQGIDQVTETVRSMENSREQMEAIAQSIKLLHKQTESIRDITALVTDFANETKMLAVNAAVEAVRAGEHGKGFAVLAVETRKLADESKQSVAQIDDLVNKIQQATHATMQVAEEGSKSVQAGMVVTRNTASNFEVLSERVERASEGAQQISLNVRQQSMAIQQVVEAMRSIHAGAQDSALGIAQVKGGIQTLDEAAQTLRKMI